MLDPIQGCDGDPDIRGGIPDGAASSQAASEAMLCVSIGPRASAVAVQILKMARFD
jgi:hypothetical protein